MRGGNAAPTGPFRRLGLELPGHLRIEQRFDEARRNMDERVGILRPGFEHAHRHPSILGQPARQNRTRRPAADDHIIKIVRRHPYALPHRIAAKEHEAARRARGALHCGLAVAARSCCIIRHRNSPVPGDRRPAPRLYHSLRAPAAGLAVGICDASRAGRTCGAGPGRTLEHAIACSGACGQPRPPGRFARTRHPERGDVRSGQRRDRAAIHTLSRHRLGTGRRSPCSCRCRGPHRAQRAASGQANDRAQRAWPADRARPARRAPGRRRCPRRAAIFGWRRAQ